MKFPVSGNTTLGDTSATVGDHLETTNAVRLFGTATLTGGRILWLRQVGVYYNTTRLYSIGIMDAAAGTTVCSTTVASLKYVIHCTATQFTAQGLTQVVKFAEPGIKFATECVVALLNGTQTGTGVLKMWGGGYEE